MTVFNKAEFVSAAIESVLNQTHTNFELIIVDDNSTDNSFEIARLFANQDTRIKLTRNNENLGDYPNRNKAIRLSKREYLKFLDADDEMQPNALETLAKAIVQFANEEPGYYFTVHEPHISTDFRNTYLTSRELFRREYISHRRTFAAAPNSCLYRRSILTEIGEFLPDAQTGDFEMAHRIASSHGAVLIEAATPLSQWREHPNQQSQLARSDLSIGCSYTRIALIFLEKQSRFFEESEITQARQRLMHAEAQSIRSSLGRFRWWQLLKILTNKNFGLLQLLSLLNKPFPLESQQSLR